MSSENSHLNEDRFCHVARRRSAIRTGAMFGGLQLVAFDPELDPPPGVCYNCRTHGHRRVKCPQPQVSALCHNCGRRGVTPGDCARHREHLARIREGEKTRKQASERELVKATQDLRIAHSHDNLIGTGEGCSRKFLLREEEAKPAESPANLRVVSVEMPSGTDSGGRESRPEYRASRPPYAKRARAGSSSRKYYFFLGRETPDGDHDNYSSRETVYVGDTYDSREKNSVEWTTDGPTGKPEKQRKYLAGDNGSSRDGSTDGDYESCAETAADENNNNNKSSTTSTRNDANESKKQSPRSYGSNWRAESDARQSDSALGRNLSARAEYSGSACGKKTPSQRAAEIEGKRDLKKFLELARKISGLSVETQELVIRHVVAERETLIREAFVGVRDPVQEFLDLVGAIAHLPIGTQNDALFEVIAELNTM